MLIAIILSAIFVVLFSILLFKNNLLNVAVFCLITFITYSICFTCLGVSRYCSSYYTEYWNNYKTKVEYYESWNEEVQCKHHKYKTVKVRNSDGTYSEREEEDGYKHSYDVEEHSEEYRAQLNDGCSISIDKSDYLKWSSRWGSIQFVDMYRHYHNKDGDKYESEWNKNFDDLAYYISFHKYENRLRKSNSIFNYKSNLISKEKTEEFEHPANKEIRRAFFDKSGYLNTDYNDLLCRYNALIGYKEQIHMMIYVFPSEKYSEDIVYDIRSVWNGTNKNELAIFYGINKSKEIVWCACLSWLDDTTLHAKIRQTAFDMSLFDGKAIIENNVALVQRYWQRKSFKDFEYIKVDYSIYTYIIMAVFINIYYIIQIIVLFNLRDKRKRNRWT